MKYELVSHDPDTYTLEVLALSCVSVNIFFFKELFLI